MSAGRYAAMGAVVVGVAFFIGLVTVTHRPVASTEIAKQVDSLYELIAWSGVTVGVVVEALIIYAAFRFHDNKKVPRGETHRGNTKIEIAWTAAPAIFLVVLSAFALNTMAKTEHPPEGANAIPIQVTGQQFAWTFKYPDGNTTTNILRVQSDTTYTINVTSRDVNHGFNVPDYSIKLDAIQGRMNHQFFTTEHVDKGAVDHFIQCTQFCGVGHGFMTTGFLGGQVPVVEVFAKGSQTKPYGCDDTHKGSTCQTPIGGK
jgi:cytochrome c oxidase subunit 2